MPVVAAGRWLTPLGLLMGLLLSVGVAAGALTVKAPSSLVSSFRFVAVDVCSLRETSPRSGSTCFVFALIS